MLNKKQLKATAVYIPLILISITSIAPFYWMLTTAFKTSDRIFAFPPDWIPNPITFNNFPQALDREPILRELFNSFYIAITVAALTCLLASLAGYAFARLKFPSRNLVFFILLTGLMVPVEVTSIPTFIAASKLGLTNTHIPLIIIPLFGAESVFSVFIMRQFFLAIPDELEEASKLDGCTPFQIYRKVFLPLARTPLIIVAVISFQKSWNDFLLPLIYIRSESLRTIPLGLSMYTTDTGIQWHQLMAASVIATVPMIIIFFAGQRYFEEGFMMSGLKG